MVIGVVMMEGWPIAHYVFNRLDQTTVLSGAGNVKLLKNLHAEEA